MARYSSAYSELVRRLREIELILSMAQSFDRMAPTPPNPARVNALCRSGVVLLCSHVEGYVERMGTLAIERVATSKVPKSALGMSFRYHLSRNLIDAIRDSVRPEIIARNMTAFLNQDGDIWDDTTNFADPLPSHIFVRRFATPNHENISNFFDRFGFDKFDRDLARFLQRDYTASKNMIDDVVDQRNKIAHGDFVTAGAPTDLLGM